MNDGVPQSQMIQQLREIINGGSDMSSSWSMGGYPTPWAGAGGPTGMMNGQPPLWNGAANFAAPPGPPGYWPSYPPPPSSNFGGPHYGGGPGWFTSGGCHHGTILLLEYFLSSVQYSS